MYNITADTYTHIYTELDACPGTTATQHLANPALGMLRADRVKKQGET